MTTIDLGYIIEGNSEIPENVSECRESLKKYEIGKNRRKVEFLKSTLPGYVKALSLYSEALRHIHFVTRGFEEVRSLMAYPQFIATVRKAVIVTRKVAHCCYFMDEFDGSLEICMKNVNFVNDLIPDIERKILYLTYSVMAKVYLAKGDLVNCRKYYEMAKKSCGRDNYSEILGNIGDRLSKAERGEPYYTDRDIARRNSPGLRGFIFPQIIFTCSSSNMKLYREKFNEVYSPEKNREFEEKIEHIIESGYLDDTSFRIQWENGNSEDILYPLHCCASPFSKSYVIKLDEKRFPSIKQDDCLKLILGGFIPFGDFRDSVITFFEIFLKTKKLDFILALFHKIKCSFLIGDLVRLLFTCINVYEDGGGIEMDATDNDSISYKLTNRFNSCFTLFVFRLLGSFHFQKRFAKNRFPDEIVSPLTKIGFFEQMSNVSDRHVSSDPYIQYSRYFGAGVLDHTSLKVLKRRSHVMKDRFCNDSSFSFETIFQRSVIRPQYMDEKYSNWEVFTADSPNKRIPVHKEFIVMKSNFFFLMLKFPGIESNSESVLIEKISRGVLEFLLETIYYGSSNKTDEMNMKELFELLVHLEMYLESEDLKKKVELKIGANLNFSMSDSKSTFSLRLLEVGKYMNDLPDSTKERMLDDWSRNMIQNIDSSSARKIIEELISISAETERLANENEELKEENSRLMREASVRKRKRDDDGDDENGTNKGRRRSVRITVKRRKKN